MQRGREQEMIEEIPNDKTSLEDIYKAVAYLMAEKFVSAAKELEEPKPISRAQHPIHGVLVRSRRLCLKCSILLIIFSMVMSFFPISLGIITGSFAIIAGALLCSLTLEEILKGAGTEIQTEFKQDNEFFRTYKFIPIHRNFKSLIINLGCGLLSVIMGYSSLYAFLFLKSIHFGTINGKISSIYFSIVTFCTVGFGDIYPISVLAKATVTSEILASLILLSVVLTTAISWAIGFQQRILDERSKHREKRMQRVEATLKKANIGVYGNLEELIQEAKLNINMDTGPN